MAVLVGIEEQSFNSQTVPEDRCHFEGCSSLIFDVMPETDIEGRKIRMTDMTVYDNQYAYRCSNH